MQRVTLQQLLHGPHHWDEQCSRSARCSETEYNDRRSQCSLPHLQSTASNRGSTVGARGSDISDTFLGASGNPSSRHELESVKSLAAFQKASSIESSTAGGATSPGGSGPEGLIQCNSGPFSGRSCLTVAERTGAARRTRSRRFTPWRPRWSSV